MATFIKTMRPEIPFIFNISKRVGQAGDNQPEDVALVSYMMRLSAKAANNAEAKKVLANTAITSTCTPELIKSIHDLQVAMKLIVDNHVSPARPSGLYGDTPFLIARCNYAVRLSYRNLWPRIDLITDAATPMEVASLVQRELIGR